MRKRGTIGFNSRERVRYKMNDEYSILEDKSFNSRERVRYKQRRNM